MLLVVCLVSLMSGLLGAWFRMRSRVPVLLGLGFLLIFLVAFGLVGVGAIWMMQLVKAEPVGLAVVTALFLVLFRLFREQSFGVLFLLCRLQMLRTLVWIIIFVVRHVACLLDGNVVLLRS